MTSPNRHPLYVFTSKGNVCNVFLFLPIDEKARNTFALSPKVKKISFLWMPPVFKSCQHLQYPSFGSPLSPQIGISSYLNVFGFNIGYENQL